jgi:ABC-type transport system involved in multi-copper enzyme maturation permease subunit
MHIAARCAQVVGAMNGLLRKEFRELRPFLLLGGFLLLLDLIEWFTEQFDMQPMSVNIVETNQALGLMLFFIAFAAGSGLLVREMDDRTLAFLDGLPVSRARVFGIKILVACMVLLLYPAGHLLMISAQHLISRQSLDHALHATLLWQTAALLCVVIGTGLAFGVLLGYLRSLCWLTLALIAFAVGTMTNFVPQVAILNPVSLLEMRLVGLQRQWPWAQLFTQLGLMAASGLLALGLFVSASGGAGRRLQHWLRRPLTSAALTLATIGVCLAVLVVFTLPSAKEAKPAGAGKIATAKFTDSPVASQRTEHYSFNYYSQQAQQAQALLKDADRIYTEVVALLGDGAAEGARIDVDLTGSMQNTEGTAFYNRIRMHLGRDPLKVLAHETSHVLALRLAGGELARELSKMSVFNEGLATWVHNQVTGKMALNDMERFQSAVVSRRHLVKPEQLADSQALARQSDISLQYPLGAALVESLVARYGRDAPKKLLLALANPDFPRSVSGIELWYAAFQAAGFDLGVTFDDYSRRLQGWEAEFSQRIAALPRPRVSLDYKAGSVGVELRWEGAMPDGWSPVVRIRPKEDSPLDHYITLQMGPGAVAWITRSLTINEQLCVQPGVRTADAAIFEAWSCVPLEPDRKAAAP